MERATASTHAEEIRWKLVSTLLYLSTNCYLSPSANRSLLSLQEQDTPNNSFFSFQIEDLPGDEEVESHPLTLGIVPDEVRTKLQNMRVLLQQDIGRLVENAEPIRRLLNELKRQVPENTEEAILPAAHMEVLRIQVTKALQCTADRENQEKLRQEKDLHKLWADDLHHRIDFLKKSRPTIVGEIDRLKARRAKLAKEMELVGHTIITEEKKLADLPATIHNLITGYFLYKCIKAKMIIHDNQRNGLRFLEVQTEARVGSSVC